MQHLQQVSVVNRELHLPQTVLIEVGCCTEPPAGNRRVIYLTAWIQDQERMQNMLSV